MLQQGPPPIIEMHQSTARAACIVVLHDPREAVGGRTDWSLSLVDITGVAIARETVSEPAHDGARAGLVQPYLALLGRTVHGEWVSSPDDRGRPRHFARIVPWMDD